MANLEGMPIGSLPEATSIQDEDEVVVYRPSTGKAYQANTDLIDSLSGSTIPYIQQTQSSFDAIWDAVDSGLIVFEMRSSGNTGPASANRYHGFQWKENANGNYGYQLCWCFKADGIYIRRRNGNTTWTDWATIS